MPLDPVKNFAKVQLSTGYAAGVTSVVLVSGDGAKLPAPATDGAFNLVWWNETDYKDPADDPDKEIVRCTARTTDTLTITRAQEETSDVNHDTAGKTYKMVLTMTKKMKDDMKVTLVGGDFVASNNLRNSNDNEKTTTATTYTKKKETKLNAALPACRIKFDMNMSPGGGEVRAKIYKNGVAIGTEQVTYGTSYVTKSEDFSGFVANDLIQIYIYTLSSYTAYVKNFRFYYDRKQNISKIEGNTLDVELKTSSLVADPTISVTNQDP